VKSSGIEVRQMRITDLARLRTMRADLLMSDQTFGPFGSRFPDPFSALPLARRDRRSFVATIEGALAGLIELSADYPNHRWILRRLLTTRRIHDREAGLRSSVWEELVLHAIRAAGAARAKRIHTALPERSQVRSTLISIGFTEYAQDSVLLARSSPQVNHSSRSIIRRQEPSDAWAVHQLYHSVTPRPVQYAEALTSNYWCRVEPGQSAARSFVVEDGLEIIAHCRVLRGGDGPVLHVMVSPDALHLLTPVVSEVVGLSRARRREPVSVLVPDYLQEYIGHLDTIGFEVERRRTRLVKYTVVARRAHIQGLEEMTREVRARAVTGASTMYYLPTNVSGDEPLSIQDQDGFS
jgi:hypothetical protein